VLGIAAIVTAALVAATVIGIGGLWSVLAATVVLLGLAAYAAYLGLRHRRRPA
jgi:hypothetical protein